LGKDVDYKKIWANASVLILKKDLLFNL